MDFSIVSITQHILRVNQSKATSPRNNFPKTMSKNCLSNLSRIFESTYGGIKPILHDLTDIDLLTLHCFNPIQVTECGQSVGLE